jgi:hypothetical protein
MTFKISFFPFNAILIFFLEKQQKQKYQKMSMKKTLGIKKNKKKQIKLHNPY